MSVSEITELPEGTVTVLFTDVVGSTKLTNRLGDEPARKVLGASDELVRKQVTEHGGIEVKGTGDGLMVAFTSARRAVASAVDIQRARIEANERHADKAIDLRIGLNTGEVVKEDADLFGATVNAAARIAAAGGPGDILISEGTKIMLGAASTFEIEEEGRKKLKGFDEPWTIYAVKWDRVRVPEPTEGEPEQRSAQISLPPLRSDVIGRDAEIGSILDALTSPNRRLVTLIGPGGVGKTTLSVVVGSRFAEMFHSGVTFVRLDVVPSPERIPAAILEALGLRQSGQGDPRRQLAEHLRERDDLLILDNFEHIIEGAELIGELLDQAPGLKVLVTSRQALGIRGEWRFAVSGLRVPDTDRHEDETSASVELFAQRAQQARSDFSLAREEADVIHICRLLEGVPLALEIAATWATTLKCAEIAAEIERGIDFLESRMVDVPERHRSMRAVFEQSWERLTQDEQQVFARLSVFRGGFERNAAAEVAGASLPVLDSLVNKSLVRSEADGRYRLHEAIRQCAAEKLAEMSGAVMETRRAHCDYYMSLLERLGPGIAGRKQLESAEVIQADFDNVVAAWSCAVEEQSGPKLLATAVTFAQFYQFRGRYSDAALAFGDTMDLLRRAPRIPELDAAMIPIGVEAAWFSIRLGRISEAKGFLEHIMAIHDELGEPKLAGFASDVYSARAVVAQIEGDFAAAEQLGRSSLERARANNDQANEALALYTLASTCSALGRYEEAREHGLRAYELTRKRDDRWFMAYCLNELGSVATALGDFEQAREYQSASYELRREFDDPEGMAVALNRLGDIAIREGEYRQAAEDYRRALAIYREIKDQGGLADAYRGLAEASFASGSHGQAARYYRESLQIAGEIGHVPMTLTVLLGVGELLVTCGKRSLGLSLLATVRSHPSVERGTSAKAAELLKTTSERTEPDSLDLSEAIMLADAELLTLEDREQPTKADHSYVEPLTEREQEVLERIAAGCSNGNIAEELVVSIGTVKAHTSNIYNKLGVHNRVQAVAKAKEAGLLPDD